MGGVTNERLRAAMDRAFEATARSRAEAERRAGQVYRFEVGFLVPASVARGLRVETAQDESGTRFVIEFYGTEEARRKVTDVIADLPTVCRSYRRYYIEGGDGDGGEERGPVDQARL